MDIDDDARHRRVIMSRDCRSRTPSSRTQDKNRSLLLDKVRASHAEALERLRPAADLDAGLCFGLLDPVSNAIVNAAVFAEAEDGNDRTGRSLDGAVTFLTTFFPHLPDWEAVRYLLDADADVLVAARLVVRDRGLRRFGFASDTAGAAVRLALRCAALAVKHPHPDRLVHAWLSLSRRLDEAVSALANHDVRGLVALVVDEAEAPAAANMERAWELAASRFLGRDNGIAAPPYRHAMPLQRTLLYAIQGFYLRALARLPSGELRSHYHRSLVKAGHCYGPMDPVSNIILNVVWYDAAHPPVEELELAMIPPKSMSSIATRSFLGLVSFLCTRYPNLGLHDAIRCLLDFDGDLNAAAREADRRQHRPSCTIQESYAAAAAAARHPKPDEQVEFLSSSRAMTTPLLLQNGGQLSSEDVRRLAAALLPPTPSAAVSPMQRKPTKPRRRRQLKLKAQIIRDQNKICRKVKAALDRYALQNNEPGGYELHVICGMNNCVSGPVYCTDDDIVSYTPLIYFRCHVNFLARRRDSDPSAIAGEGALQLFFAECGNYRLNHDGICCPVTISPPCSEQVRCLYCEHEGVGIMHPSIENFHGREVDFEKMVCGEDTCGDEFDPEIDEEPFYTNDGIVNSLKVNILSGLEEEFIYRNSDEGTDEEEGDSDDDIDFV
ncbi:uncharacterized protein [Oryza sativa Japonica Group]|uniref:Os05g0571300 protein n=3 Tax=Oryza sativa subsp. japonica TaxID=39947 RepID=Q65XL3_ORYSJ|nr:uncharacterized protein LOC9267436 [Oryza sativa Japonica Group]AAU44094.1 unknown protein [Oryza sativa Japonica Group]KAF2932203.1 hypothetical protein DAI22_05g270100 [Oryza sativa Japonica Group]BAG92898.1 unnamed protein product [Oryza sativa Japonica Group]BAH93263.1 Os05g0571300 [Oryza sativa Japonica Group]BAS95428.1 Os05g0571300 [Oryza sativa Japonica Group]|eukprot:NP_001174535.1 Os05g0571300 [Oryza sativa Japonica Group]